MSRNAGFVITLSEKYTIVRFNSVAGTITKTSKPIISSPDAERMTPYGTINGANKTEAGPQTPLFGPQSADAAVAFEELKKANALANNAVKLYQSAKVSATNALELKRNLAYYARRFEPDWYKAFLDVTQDGKMLRSLPFDLRNYYIIADAAVKQNGLALEWTSIKLRGNIDLVINAVKQNGLALYWASPMLKKYRSVILTAVKQNGHALRFCHRTQDRKIVLAAVKQNGLALVWVSGELRNDREIVLAAVKQNVEALKYIGSQLWDDREFILAIVK